MVSGHLEESLRQEIETYIETRLSRVKDELAQLQSQVNDSISRLLERPPDVALDGSVSSSILEHLRAAHEEGIDLAASESSRAKASSDMAIIKAAVSEIGEQNEQAQVLRILVNRAASFAPRVAFFAIKNERAIGWRARGFEGTVGDNAIQQISVAVSADTIIGDVSKSKTTWSGGPHSHPEDHLILNRLGEEPPQRIISIPMIVRNRAVAVLYADSAGLGSEAINLEALETLVQVSGMAVELLAAHAPAKQPAAEAAQVEQPAAPEAVPGYVPEREYVESAPSAAPEPLAPEAEAEPEAKPILEAEAIEPKAFEGLLPAAESSAEAPAQQPTGELADQFAAPPAAKRRYGMDAELPVTVDSEDERQLHNYARRFARLLVSEIKLYNEQKVVDGRQQGDLYDRLREYIDRSREMYDNRVKPEVTQKFDYFHHELVNTLAEGDAAKLGHSYPGAAVSA